MSRCPLCGQPLMILFHVPEAALRQITAGSQQDRALAEGRNIKVVRTFPESQPPVAHPTWPVKIREPFLDLQQMLAEGRHPSFIISGCRSILDVSTKELGAGKGPLIARIDELAQQGIVTGAVKDWAHKLRMDGNAATHELEGTREDAVQLVEFIKLFLHVGFELPAAIKTASASPTI